MKAVVRIETITERSSGAYISEARAMLMEYGRFILEAEGLDAAWFAKLEDEARGLPLSFAKRGGAMLIASIEDRAAGCVTYRALPHVAGGCEMKRLWVRDGFRGAGVGERLVEALIASAAAAGYEAVYCDTIPATMGAAYRMYLRLGFEPCTPYHSDGIAGIAFLRRALAGHR